MIPPPSGGATRIRCCSEARGTSFGAMTVVILLEAVSLVDEAAGKASPTLARGCTGR